MYGGALCVGVCVCGGCVLVCGCVWQRLHACVCVTVYFANKLQKYFKGCHNHVALKSPLESATLSPSPRTSKEKKQEPGKTREDKTSEQQAASSSSTCLRICKIYRRHHYATISPAHTTSPPLHHSFATPLKSLSASLCHSLALCRATAAAT